MSFSYKNTKEHRERDLQIFQDQHTLGMTTLAIAQKHNLSLIRVKQILHQERKRNSITTLSMRSLPILVDRLNKQYSYLIDDYCHANLSIDGMIKRIASEFYFANNEQGARDLLVWLKGTTFETLKKIKGFGSIKIDLLIRIRDELRAPTTNVDDFLVGIRHIYE